MKESDFCKPRSDNVTRAAQLIAEDIRNGEAKGEPYVWGMTLADVAIELYFTLNEAKEYDAEKTYTAIGAGFASNLMPSYEVPVDTSSGHL
jgi:hypothetical protein